SCLTPFGRQTFLAMTVKKVYPFLRVFCILSGSVLAACLAGCISHVQNPITRTETDYYTITDRDTTVRETERNVPGSAADNGVVFPSSRQTYISRSTLSHDSTYDRTYPNFLRYGGIETAGLMGSSSLNGLGPGLFGIFALFNSDQFLTTSSGQPVYGTIYHPTDSLHPQNSNGSQLFKGELIRLMPYEYRLRWFNDAPNWTIGWSAFELLAQDENRAHWLTSYATNVYLRRRIFIRDQIPYLIFSPFFGVSVYPSAYINLGGELQFGSLAGLNIRAYAGFAGGFNQWSSPITKVSFPYLGLGVSALDFTNTVEETEREWKYYAHTGINVNILEASVLAESANYESFFDTSVAKSFPLQGLQLKLANVEIPLPIGNYHLWAGTSLINWMAMSFDRQGISVLPLRVGYRQYIFAEDLMFEPFIEYNYYPSSIINIGARLKLDTWTHQNIGITLGYASGSPGAFSPQLLNTGGLASATNFSTAYLGLTLFLGDWNKSPETIRALHETTNDPWSPSK
ncbi:MAG TPA: hypothetical protein VFX22_05405, partial [Candidatus Kapabacteria bacterium]|nr:hypothetical protein [Candidatus Kapabacteria bacterium]